MENYVSTPKNFTVSLNLFIIYKITHRDCPCECNGQSINRAVRNCLANGNLGRNEGDLSIQAYYLASQRLDSIALQGEERKVLYIKVLCR